MKTPLNILIVVVITVSLFTGCHTDTTITHSVASSAKPTHQKAIQVISNLRGRLPTSDQFTRMEKVDTTGFDYAADNKPTDGWFVLIGTPFGPILGPMIGEAAVAAAKKASAGYHPHLGRVNFADIWKMELLTFSFNNDSCIRLFLHNEPHKYFDVLCRKNQPEVNNAILSALLVLCPNIK